MRKNAIAAASVGFCLLWGTTTGSACGDKLLNLNRMYRHRIAVNSTVAVFARPDSLLANTPTMNLSKAFHEEGYHLLLVSSDRDLTLALQAGAVDVVIADISDVTEIQQRAIDAKVPIIPVVGKDGFESKSESRRYLASIKSPVKTDKFLDALDRAFSSSELRQNDTKAKAIRTSF